MKTLWLIVMGMLPLSFAVANMVPINDADVDDIGACWFNDHNANLRCVDAMTSSDCAKFKGSQWKQGKACADKNVSLPTGQREDTTSTKKVTITNVYIYGSDANASLDGTIKSGGVSAPFSLKGTVHFSATVSKSLNIPFNSIYNAEAYLFDTYCTGDISGLPASKGYFYAYSSNPYAYIYAYGVTGKPTRASFIYASTAETPYYSSYVYCNQ